MTINDFYTFLININNNCPPVVLVKFYFMKLSCSLYVSNKIARLISLYVSNKKFKKNRTFRIRRKSRFVENLVLFSVCCENLHK